MKKLLLTPATTVEKALECSAQASRLFIDHCTACNGCPLKRFCTLEEMARIYAIDLPPFLETLQQFQNKTV